jgi:chromosome segregation ATPase
MIPFPYNILGTIALLAGAFFSGWTAQGWHRDSQEKDNAEQKLVEVRDNAATSIRRADTVIEAQNAAKVRDRDLRIAISLARDERERLRVELEESQRQLAGLSAEACIKRAATLSDVLNQCTERYTGVAEKADRHANDVQTLTDAWPVK